MRTVNADTHSFYKRFHKPGEEKRMPIFLNAGEDGRENRRTATRFNACHSESHLYTCSEPY